MGCSLIAVLLTAGCGYGQPGDEPPVTDGTTEGQGSWQVEVAGVWNGDVGACVSDPAVGSAWQTADVPSSHFGLALIPEAGESDADRVAECLQTVLPQAEITVRQAAGTTAFPQEPPVTAVTPAGPDPSARPEPGPESFCDARQSPSAVQEGEETTGSVSCAHESVPLTREEMMNATPMPMPVHPAPPAPFVDPTGTPGDRHSDGGTAGRAQRAEPAPMPNDS